jgi:enhanced entry protein EnhC
VKIFMPWLCLVTATHSGFIYANINTGTEDYRQGRYLKALEAFSKQTKYDSIESYYLGRMSLYGYGQLKNNARAIRYFSQAAEGGFLPAQEIMALHELLEKNNPTAAFYWFQKSADANDARAQMYCASAYLFGYGVSKNSDKARKYYIGAAKQGNPIAQYAVAENFLDSRQGANKQLGLIWLNKAVAQQNPKAQLLLSKLFFEGKVVSKDLAKATELLDLAIKSGYPPALMQKGDMALQNKDFNGAKEWYTKAIDLDYLPANVALGSLYLDEKTPLYDAHAGYLLILNAAQKNLEEAELALALMYKNGQGVPASMELSQEWQKKAAQNPSKRPESQAANWLSNGRDTRFSSSGYDLKGISKDWKNAQALRENSYNPSPQMIAVTRDMIYKPNFSLINPNEISISDYFDALSVSLDGVSKASLTFAPLPMDETVIAIKEAAHANNETSTHLIEKIQTQASLGNSVAEFELGQVYQYGVGTKPNLQEAIRNYELAANQESLPAMYALGLLYLDDTASLQADYAKGLAWLHNAAFKGSGPAQLALARIYEQGLNRGDKMVLQPSPQQADGMYFLAAANDDGPAEYRLAEILVRKKQDDVSVAAKVKRQAMIKSLYQGAVANGVKEAILPLAFFNAMDPDKAKQTDAFNVATQEAKSGASPENAALLLGLMYDRGIGVKASQSDAIHWYQQAGKNPVTNFILGTYTSLGIGLSQDSQQGLAMLQGAADADFPYANLNVAVLNQMEKKPFVPELEKALAFGNSRAGLLLADYYLSTASEDAQIKQARDIYQLFAMKGDSDAQLKFAYMHEQGLGGKVDFNTALTWYTSAASQGQVVAQYLVGRLYQLGYLDPIPDYALAKQWYSRAQSSYAPAAIALGFVYETVDDNYKQAQASYAIAMDKHDPVGQYNMGLIYEEGKGQEIDLKKAEELYKEASLEGHVKAMTRLAGLYFNGVDGKGDPQLALEWYQKAAEKHDKDAQYQLGLLSETGVATALDYAKALTYYEQSASSGSQQGMLAAARMHQYGIGVPANKKQAAVYYEQLAGLGNAFAQYQLATLYNEKILSETTHGEGKKWLAEALKNGSPQASQAMQCLAAQTQNQLSFVQPILLNQTPSSQSKPVELMYMDALNQWNCGNEQQAKVIFNRIRDQFPDYTPAKHAYEQMSLG